MDEFSDPNVHLPDHFEREYNPYFGPDNAVYVVYDYYGNLIDTYYEWYAAQKKAKTIGGYVFERIVG